MAKLPSRYKSKKYREKCLQRLKKFYTVNRETDCWEWNKEARWCKPKEAPKTYGMFSFGMRWRLEHRVSYALHNEDIDLLDDPKIFCCHRCDNRRCINPKHLFLGTHHDNMQDMVAKGRAPKGHQLQELTHTSCPHCHKKL
jgi:hypothetical protein